jgi:hypothetical protein
MKKIILYFLVLILTCLNASGISYTIRNNIEPDRFYISKLANADQSIDLYLTVTSGKLVYINWGDGTITQATANGTEVKHTKAYDTAGAYRAFVYGELSYVTGIKCSSEPISVVYTLADIKDRFPRLTYLSLSTTSSVITGALADLPSTMKTLSLSTTSSVITGALADLPSTMQQLYLSTTSSVITGALADLPSTMQQLYLYSTSSVITGALADLPSTMQQLYLYSTSSVITGGATHAPYGITDIRLHSTSMSQANVNDVINRIYADRASFTYATPQLQIGGTNPDPSGTYQNVCSPTTELEKVYELVNDQCGGNFNNWTITY